MRKSRVLAWVLGGLCVVVGVGLVFTWSAFAALYVPQCPKFSISASESACRNPAVWVMVGYGVAALGGIVLVANVTHAIWRRTRPGAATGGSRS